jgi:hypothetical protein
VAFSLGHQVLGMPFRVNTAPLGQCICRCQIRQEISDAVAVEDEQTLAFMDLDQVMVPITHHQ